MHIVSDVRGKLDPVQGPDRRTRRRFSSRHGFGRAQDPRHGDHRRAGKDKRGPYAGCIGYFGADGSMDTCIVLRTAIVKDGRMHVQAGAGIVADSVAASEQAECINKAKALFRAAQAAADFATAPRRGQ